MSGQSWLDGLKAGDQACTYHRFAGYHLYVVERRTPAGQIIMQGGSRFDRRGEEITVMRHDRGHLQPVTEQVLAEIEHSRLVHAVHREIERVGNINHLNKLSSERLAELLAVLKQGEQR